jgi:hypothetical protein
MRHRSGVTIGRLIVGIVVEELYHEGITQGCSSGPLLYCPTADVFRAQMAIFLVRTFNLPFP